MNDTLKIMGLILLGATIGGGIGFILAERHYKAIWEKQLLNPEVEKRVRDALNELEKENYKVTIIDAEEPVEDLPVKKEPKKRKRVVRPDLNMDNTPVSYHKILPLRDLEELAKKYKTEEFDPDESVGRPEFGGETVPYIVSFEDYLENPLKHQQLTMYYYSEDAITTPMEDATIIENPDKLFGLRALVRFGLASNDPNMVYVRNERLKTDYEIVRIPDSYSGAVLGIEPEEKPKRKAKNGKSESDSSEDS